MTHPSLSGDVKTISRRMEHLRERIARFEAEPVMPKAIEYDRGELAALERIVAYVEGQHEQYKVRRKPPATQAEMLKGLEEVEALLQRQKGTK